MRESVEGGRVVTGKLPLAHTRSVDTRPLLLLMLVSCVCFVNVDTDLLPRAEVNVVSGCVG